MTDLPCAVNAKAAVAVRAESATTLRTTYEMLAERARRGKASLMLRARICFVLAGAAAISFARLGMADAPKAPAPSVSKTADADLPALSPAAKAALAAAD